MSLILASMFVVFTAGCPAPEGESTGAVPGFSTPSRPGHDETPLTNSPEYIFKERASELGLAFLHHRGSFGRHHVGEITCAGGGFLDVDNDGDLDVYLAQGGELGPQVAGAMSGSSWQNDRLFRNDLLPGGPVPGGSLRFTDVTEASGLGATPGYGCGVATGDYDNDGWTDLLVHNLGPNQLWRNQGDGTFRDVTAEAAPGLAIGRSSVAASFFDYDRDGWLDLFVGNYVTFDFVDPPRCTDQTGAPDYCGPTAFPDEANQVWRNLGPANDGRVRFEEVTSELGIDRVRDPTLGVTAADFNGDGWPDVYVANDGEPNRLWINGLGGQGGGGAVFSDEAVLAGCSVNSSGASEASMGVTAGDADGDGDLDLFLTHLLRETNTLYLNDGQGFFEDRTLSSGLGAGSLSYTSFGTGFLDYDNDGRLDLLIVNGAVTKLPSLWSVAGADGEEKQRDRGDGGDGEFPLDLPNQLFRNVGDAGKPVRFADVTAEAGPGLALSEVSRGAALGDVDNDGDLDVLIVNNGGPVRLLLNEVGHRSPWLGLRLVDEQTGHDLLGARAAVLRAGRPLLWRRVHVDGSYNAAHDPRLVFGLGDDAGVEGVRVVWPDGSVEEWDGVQAGRYTTLVRGSGRNVDG